MSSTALSVSVTKSEEFFFVSILVGLAEVIMSPALRASSKRKSWILLRSGDEGDMMVLDGVAEEWWNF